MKFKVGNKVELLNGGESWPLLGYKTNGIYTVAEYPESAPPLHKARGLIPITGGHQKHGYAKPEQLKLVEPKQTKNQRITELEKQVANLLENQETLIKRLDTTERNAFSNMQNTQNLTYELNQLKKRVEELEELHKRKVTMRDVINKVLSEPETIEFEGQKYRKVDREAKPGDVVILRGDNLPEWFTKGKAYKINKFGKIDECDSGYRDYDVYKEQCGRTTENVDVYEPIQQEKSPNQLRKEIIEKAKEFVEKRSKGSYYNAPHFISGEPFAVHFGRTDVLEFVVNEKKRAVVALIKTKKGRKVFHRGIAKCHPQDVFNEHIGKAIALGRALNLDVSEFEQAVQPNRLVKGHKIKGDKEEGSVVDVNSVEFRLGSGGVYRYDNYDFKIIDDTNAIYDEVNANAQRPYQTHNA